LNDPESLGSIISRANVPGPKKKKQRLDLLAVNWEHIAGQRMAEHSIPTRLIRGTLTVAADSPSWAAELTMATENILTRIGAIMGDDGVRKVKVRSREKGAGIHVEARAEGEKRGGGDGGELTEEISRQIGEVSGEELARALARLVRASKSSKQYDQSGE